MARPHPLWLRLASRLHRPQTASPSPPFEEVRDFVAREYEYQSVLQAQDQVYESLLTKYEVIITADTSPAGMPTELAPN
jgi:hypothetical protein